MSNKQYAKLIMVEVNSNPKPGKAAQSNKYYEMEWDGVSSNFNVKYGRVESTTQTGSYPLRQWQSKYNEKIRKGYKDVTDLVTVQVEDNKAPEDVKISKIQDSKVESFMSLMKRYTDNLVSTTYSVKATNVSQKQVDEAQRIIDHLNKYGKTADPIDTNQSLVQLYTVIPRQMRDVRQHLLPRIDLGKTLDQEQANLDAMASQVAQITETKQEKKAKKKAAQTLLDILGITMKETKCTPEIQYLVNQCTSKRVDGIFEVSKSKEDKVFDTWMSKQKNKQTKVLIHGTRCSSVIPILEIGLKIRPSGNFQFSGKVYGDGNYFSETVSKSLNYTGYDSDKILLVYEVHTGNPFVYDGWYRGNSFSLTYKNLQERGFDSTFVKAGGGLLNTEIIAYKEEQCRIKYIIHLKN